MIRIQLHARMLRLKFRKKKSCSRSIAQAQLVVTAVTRFIDNFIDFNRYYNEMLKNEKELS